MAYLSLRGMDLRGITPQQYTQLQQQLFALQNQLAQENQAWAFAVANSANPPASDQHNVTVTQLNAQISAVMQQLQQPVDWPSAPPAPSPAVMAPAPAPGAAPSIAPAPAPAAMTVQTSASPPLTPSELATSNIEVQSGETMIDAHGNVVPKPATTNHLWLLLAAGAAVYLGS